MIIKPWVLIVAGAVGLGLLGFSLISRSESTSATDDNLERVVIGHTDGQFITLFTIFIGEQLGVFAKYGLEMVPESMESKVAVAALLSGSVDFSTISREVTTASLKGGDTRFVMLLINNQMQYLVGRDGIQPSEIRTIAVTNMYSTPHYLSLKAMERGGFSAEIKFMGSIPAVRAAVAKGDADAGIFGYFAPVDFEASGLNLLDDFGNESLLIGLSTTKKKIDRDAEQVERVVTAFSEVIEYIQTHPEETKSFLYDYYEYDENVDTERRKVEAAYDGLNRFLSSSGSPTNEERVRFVQSAKANEYVTLEDIYNIEVTSEDMNNVFDLRFVE